MGDGLPVSAELPPILPTLPADDFDLSVESLLAELEITQYRDAFATAGIDDGRLRDMYCTGADAVEAEGGEGGAVEEQEDGLYFDEVPD